MPKNDNKKNRNEKIEDNVRKVYGDENVSNVLSGSPDEIKDKMAARNEEVIKKAKKDDASIARLLIDDGDTDLAFPFKKHIVIASDGGVGVCGEIKPNELADLVNNIVRGVLINHGVDPDDERTFNMNAALVLELAAFDFLDNESTPYKILKRFTRLMDAIEELITE